MPCTPVKLGDFTAIVCTRWGHDRCRVRGCRSHAIIECDYPVVRDGKITTCDRAVCRRHSKNVGPDCDYCDKHRLLPEPPPPPKDTPDQLGLFGDDS